MYFKQRRRKRATEPLKGKEQEVLEEVSRDLSGRNIPLSGEGYKGGG